MKPILALDSSGKTAAVCLWQNGAPLYGEVLNEGLTHSQTLLPLCMRVLAECGLTPADIGLFAVTAGPGSFTGLRIGMALAKGLALPAGAPLAAVSTLEAWAVASKLTGIVVPALDARRGEVYWAAFECGTAVRRLMPDTAGKASDIPIERLFFEQNGFFVGDGAEICYTIFNCGPKLVRPRADFAPNVAEGVAAIAAAQQATGGLSPAADAHPEYLRLSQAERERARQNQAVNFEGGRP